MAQRLNDGHPTRVTFSLNTTIKLWEKSITPPSLSAGGENDTTTMRKVRWRGKQPKKLITLGNMSGTYAYDPAVYDELVAILGINQSIEVKFSDLSRVTFWGWVDEATFNEIVEGEQPTVEITVIASNEDLSFNEIGPVYAAA